MVLLRRKRVLAAKIETTPGTAESLAAADANKFDIFEGEVNPQIDFTEREGQAFFSPLPGVLGARGGQCTFQTEIITGSPPGWAAVFLPACGWVLDGSIYKPKTAAPGADVKTLTIGMYEDGLFKQLRGCMGTCVFTFNSSERAMAQFTFTGIWDNPTDVPMLSFSSPSARPMMFRGSTVSVGGVTPVLQQVTIDMGNDVQLREDASDDTGYATALIVGRRPTGSMNPESRLVADEDRHGDWLDRTEKAMSLILDDGDGNTVEFAAPKLQYTNIQEGERNNIQVDNLEYQCNRDAGDDELTIEHTEAV